MQDKLKQSLNQASENAKTLKRLASSPIVESAHLFLLTTRWGIVKDKESSVLRESHFKIANAFLESILLENLDDPFVAGATQRFFDKTVEPYVRTSKKYGKERDKKWIKYNELKTALLSKILPQPPTQEVIVPVSKPKEITPEATPSPKAPYITTFSPKLTNTYLSYVSKHRENSCFSTKVTTDEVEYPFLLLKGNSLLLVGNELKTTILEKLEQHLNTLQNSREVAAFHSRFKVSGEYEILKRGQNWFGFMLFKTTGSVNFANTLFTLRDSDFDVQNNSLT